MKAYFIKRSDNEETFLKVGVTRFKDVNERHSFQNTKLTDAEISFGDKFLRMLNGEKYLADGPYPKVEALFTVEFKHEGQALLLEKRVLEKFKHIQYWPKLTTFSGRSECFEFSEENQKQLLHFIQAETASLVEESSNVLGYMLAGWEVSEQDPIKRYLAIVERMKKRFG